MSVGFRTKPVRSIKIAKPSARKQDRALVTREQLLDSARKIFARDGFEQARIEDISTLSGKSRGAFYANFKDKEDVFFAIFEEHIAQDQEKVCALLRVLPTGEQRIAAFAAYLSGLARDRQRSLLALEFKVYAVRHPRRRKRLAELHAAMCLRWSLPEIVELLPELAHQSASEKRAGCLTISAVIDGLALNRLFDPEGMDETQIGTYLSLCVREMLRLAQSRESRLAIPGKTV